MFGGEGKGESCFAWRAEKGTPNESFKRGRETKDPGLQSGAVMLAPNCEEIEGDKACGTVTSGMERVRAEMGR